MAPRYACALIGALSARSGCDSLFPRDAAAVLVEGSGDRSAGRARDRLAILDLCYPFSDAVNQRDTEAFLALWPTETDSISSRIGQPIDTAFAGRWVLAEGIEGMLSQGRFFVQLTHGGSSSFGRHPDRATGRIYMSEYGTEKKGRGNTNVCYYEDIYVSEMGQWRCHSRRYATLYASDEALPGRSYIQR